MKVGQPGGVCELVIVNLSHYDNVLVICSKNLKKKRPCYCSYFYLCHREYVIVVVCLLATLHENF